MDPNTPLIDSGNYTRHELASHGDLQRTAVAMAWAGGDVFLVRTMPDFDPLGAGARLDLMRLNADGLPDAGFGYEGARRVDTDFSYRGVEVHWADQRLVAAAAQLTTTRLLLFDLTRNGDPVATFGANGVLSIAEAPAPTINAQVAHQGTGAAFRVMAAWGKKGKQAAPPALQTHTIRYGVLDDHGAFTTAARDLVTGVAGTARHGWFHFAETETPPHSIAAWHSPVGAPGASTMAVFINRFEPNGRAQAVNPAPAAYVARPPLQLTALPGDSQNAVIAPRPQAPAPTGTGITAGEIATWKQRQYGVAWQYRPNHNTAWGIYFSRLARDGTLVFPAPVPVPAPRTRRAGDLQRGDRCDRPAAGVAFGRLRAGLAAAAGRRGRRLGGWRPHADVHGAGRSGGARRFELWRGAGQPGAAVPGECQRRRRAGLCAGMEWAHVPHHVDGEAREQDLSHADGAGGAAQAGAAGL